MINYIEIRTRINTDGDLSIDAGGINKDNSLFNYRDGIYRLAKKIKADDYKDPILFKKDDLLKMHAKNTIENIIVNLRFSDIRYYLIPLFYNFFEQAIEAINHYPSTFEETGSKGLYVFKKELGGNYEGTKIIIFIATKPE